MRLAIVGAGPSCTYLMTALCTAPPATRPRSIDVYDPSGCFGSGLTYGAGHAGRTVMNRLASQTGIHLGPPGLLSRHEATLGRPLSLSEAIADDRGQQYLLEHPFPTRRGYGTYLERAFRGSVAQLENERTRVELHQIEIEDICDTDDELQMHAQCGPVGTFDRIVLAMGHGTASDRGSLRSRGVEDASAAAATGRPLHIVGQGLTSMDLIAAIIDSGTRGLECVAVGARSAFPVPRPSYDWTAEVRDDAEFDASVHRIVPDDDSTLAGYITDVIAGTQSLVRPRLADDDVDAAAAQILEFLSRDCDLSTLGGLANLCEQAQRRTAMFFLIEQYFRASRRAIGESLHAHAPHLVVEYRRACNLLANGPALPTALSISHNTDRVRVRFEPSQFRVADTTALRMYCATGADALANRVSGEDPRLIRLGRLADSTDVLAASALRFQPGYYVENTIRAAVERLTEQAPLLTRKV